MTPQLFADLKISKDLTKALDRLGFEEASPVQAAVLSAVAGRRSAVIAAPPASGRRVAVALAAVESSEAAAKQVEVVVLTSTRERALQLAAAVRSLTLGRKGPGCAVVVAGRSPERLAAVMDTKPGILIGTPGRVRAALHEAGLSQDSLNVVILDGADDLFEAGNGAEIEGIVAAGRKSLCIVAVTTFISPDVESLAGAHCPDADRVVVSGADLPSPLTWYDLDPSARVTALSLLADRHLIARGILYANSPLLAVELAGQLSAAGYPSEAVVADLTAAARERALKKFRSGDAQFLVTTNAGIAGVEVEPVDIVVHCEWPLDDGCIAERQAALRPGGQGFALASGRQVVRARAFSRRGSPARLGRLPVLAEVPEIRLQANVERLRDALSVRNPAACRTIVDILVADGFEPAVIAGAAIRLLGPPELPPQAVPAPFPVPVREPVAPPVESAPPEYTRSQAAEPVAEESLPAEEPSDWSPGISVAPAGDYADGASAESGDAGDGNGDDGNYSGGAYTADGYVITDNVSEDGVVYPPGANFGEETAAEFGYPGGAGGDRRRGGRRERGGRERGGRGRGEGGGGGGGGASPGMKRLWLNVGRMDRIQPKDIVGCILGESGVPPVSVGRVQLFERHSLVDVSVSFESQILEALNRTNVRGRKLKAKVAAY